MIFDFLKSNDFLLLAGLLCLVVGIYFSWNMFRTRELQRSAYFWKFEFSLVGLLYLTFIKDMAVFFDIKIGWLFVALEMAYMPANQIILALAAIYLNLHINSKFKSKKLI